MLVGLGLVLQGGVGHLTREFGLTVNNLLEVPLRYLIYERSLNTRENHWTELLETTLMDIFMDTNTSPNTDPNPSLNLNLNLNLNLTYMNHAPNWVA